MITDKNRVYDGWFSLEGGVDAGRSPTLLEPNQCVSANNMVFRGGHPTVRPGFRKLTENFLNADHCYTVAGVDTEDFVPTQEAWRAYKHGFFQCAVGYSPHHGEDCLMAMVNGRLFKIVPGVAEAKVTEIVLPYRNTYLRQIAYMLQADKWLIVQDGQSKPILYDGATARRSKNDITDPEKTEVPVGTIMAYGMGRVCVIVNDRDVAFGDLHGSHEGPDPSDSLILFTERNFLAGGFDAAIPFEHGKATGMVFFPQLDTSTGNGQLMVFSERGASSFFLSLPRELWQTSQFQIHALSTTGLRGDKSVSVVNEDLWFRAEDGYRSYRQARSEATGWSHIPLSTNVKQFLNLDTPRLLKFGSAIYFDNRIIGTCTPHWNQMRRFHNGMVVVDFDIISAFGTKNRPAWDGHWSKMRICQLVTGNFNGITRAFIFGMEQQEDREGNTKMSNQLYEISLDDRDDWDGLVEWELVSRGFDFSKLSQQGNSFTENELYDGDVWLERDYRMTCTHLKIFYRPDNYPNGCPGASTSGYSVRSEKAANWGLAGYPMRGLGLRHARALANRLMTRTISRQKEV